MWLLFQMALHQHLSVRIGLEDELQLPSGAMATGNEQLQALSPTEATRKPEHPARGTTTQNRYISDLLKAVE